MMESQVLAMLANPTVRDVFRTVVQKRRIRFNDLAKLVHGTTSPVSKEEVQHVLDDLRAANLIEAEPAPVQDFQTYYITADGLMAARELNRLDAAMSGLRSAARSRI